MTADVHAMEMWRQLQLYNQGVLAAATGLGKEMNPYCDKRAVFWVSGWDDEKEAQNERD